MIHIWKGQRKAAYLRCVLPIHCVYGRCWTHALIHVCHELMMGRMVARVRPEVSRTLHCGRCCRNSAVISPGRRGRCTPTRNFEAKKFPKSRGCMANFRYRTLLKWSDTLGLKKRIRQWRCRLPFKGDLTDALCEPLSPNRLWWRDPPLKFGSPSAPDFSWWDLRSPELSIRQT